MITIKSIAINSIRGIKELELSLNGKSLIILGENGMGKSSIVDALEFFFTGTISHLTTSKGLSVKSHGKHALASKSDVGVTLEFNPGGIKLTRTFSSDFPCPEQYKVMFEEAERGTFILRRSQIMEFIHSKPSDRFDLISNILGFKNLDNLEDAFKQVVNHFEKTLEGKNNAKSTLLDQLSEQLSSKIQNISSMLDIVNYKLKSLGFPSLTSLNNIDTYISDFLEKYGNLLDESKINNLLKIQTITSSQEIDHIEHKINKFNVTRENISSTQLTKIPFINLLNEGRKIIADNDLDECPLCESKIDRSQAISRIEKSLINLNTISSNVSNLRKELTEIIDSLQKIKSALLELDASLKFFQSDFHNQIMFVNQIITKLDVFINAIVLGKELLNTVNYDEFKFLADLIEKVFIQSNEKAEVLYNNIKSNKEEDVINIIKLLENITSTVGTLKKIDHDIALVEQKLAMSKTIKTAFLNTKNNIVQQIHEAIEKEIEMFYSIIHPNEDHSNIKLIVDLSKDGSTNLQVKSYEKLVDPRAFQSEGHLDSLGLCIFLALIKRFNKECSLVVLDDIVATIDASHRGRICNLLYGHFPEKQFIITTCDSIWYDQLVNSQKAFGCRGKFENKIITEWNLEKGPILSSYLPRTEKIKDNLKRGDKTGAANEIRQYLEWLLKKICEAIKAEVPFQSSGRYTVADLLGPSKRRIVKLSKNQDWERDIVAKYQALEFSFPIANVLSHDNLDARNISKNEIQHLFDAVVGLHQAFLCSKCEGPLEYVQVSNNLQCVNDRCESPTIYKTS